MEGSEGRQLCVCYNKPPRGIEIVTIRIYIFAEIGIRMGQLIGSGTCSCIEQVYSAVASYVVLAILY